MDANWWYGAIAYQIYPRSFMDGSGDGVGDLAGIIAKLPYLERLGVTMLWLSPIFVSPMVDNGYDVADYRAPDPMFGTLEELRELFNQAAKRNIRILLDLVINHSSDQHPWFQSAISDPNSPNRDYYIFREGVGGGPPNNWRSFFGGSAWEKLPGQEQYYLHAFAVGQPDLNWENPRLREEIYRIIHWWMDLGAAGFRIDAASVIKKDQRFANLPPDGPDGLTAISSTCLLQPGIEVFFSELRNKAFAPRGAFTVAEAAGIPAERLGEFVGPDGYFSAAFDFTLADIDLDCGGWCRQRDFTTVQMREILFNLQAGLDRAGGCGAPYLENHDQPRSPNKFLRKNQRTAAGKKMLGMLLLGMPGVPFVYQGEELGITNYPWKSMAQMGDVAVPDQYQAGLADGLSAAEAFQAVRSRARDNSRTPMLWENAPYAGFSTAKPWLPVHPRYPQWNAKRQQAEEGSVLRFYQRLIALRKECAQLFFRGEFEPCCLAQPEVIAYRRTLGSEREMVVCSFSDAPVTVELPTGTLLLGNRRAAGLRVGGPTTLRPLEALLVLQDASPSGAESL